MKRTMKVASSLVVSLALVCLLFLFLVAPARAPAGGKQWTGGRTIASLQEEDFDRRLLRLQLCHGVKLVADSCTLERRRVCKAMLVHDIESALAAPGHFLKGPVEFHCEDTALARPGVEDDDSVLLRPNAEAQAIAAALEANLQENLSAKEEHLRASSACQFLTDCKWAMRPSSFSVRKLASCAFTTNATHRKVLLNEVGSMVFGGKAAKRRTLYSNLVEPAGK